MICFTLVSDLGRGDASEAVIEAYARQAQEDGGRFEHSLKFFSIFLNVHGVLIDFGGF